MVKEKKKTGLSPDMIIHPGETLAEMLCDRNMSQKELAARADVSEKHISTVIKGQRSISANFAKKLEYALEIDAGFWINLQGNYDKELLELEELNNISNDEISILKPLRNVIEYLDHLGVVKGDSNPVDKVLRLRKFLCVSNLKTIPSITYNAAFRTQRSENINIDVYVLFAWQRICEYITSDITVETFYRDNLVGQLNDIKKLMFSKSGVDIHNGLKKIFASCGIAFGIVQHFKGAPVQGFIKSNDRGRIILCMTLRNAYVDIFWFSLFHEIGHILNNDIKHKYIHFSQADDNIEKHADQFASDFLLNPMAYKSFVKKGDFSLTAIKQFARQENVITDIVIGRLQKESHLKWSDYPGEKKQYAWDNN